MHEIEFHKEADQEMKAAAAYYEERVTGLGGDFLDEIEQGLSRIQRSGRYSPIKRIGGTFLSRHW